jgi:hypothetical protein
MLRKGSIDLVISKPVSRTRLLLFKYFGGLTFLFLNASFIIVAVWIIVGLRSGIWAWGFLLTIPILTFFFAILYAFSVFIGVLTRNSAVCILLTCVIWFMIWFMGWLYADTFPDQKLPDSAAVKIAEARKQSSSDSWGLVPQWAAGTIKAMHKALPRMRDLGKLTTRLISQDLISDAERRYEGVETPLETTWLECLGISSAWIVFLLGVSCWLFTRRDF